MRKCFPLVGLIVFGVCIFSRDGLGTAEAGFTGPNVPALGTMKGDLDITGVTLANGRANIPVLMRDLLWLHATDFFQVIQPDNSESWDDFQLMAPVFQQAGIHLWAYLYPHGLSTPYGGDYVTWGKQIATIGTQYPMVSGLAIDDFSENTTTFTTSYCKSIMNAAHAIDPALALLATTYYDQRSRIASVVKAGAIDGVLFPYRIQQNGTEYFQDTSQLAPEISSFRSFLDQQTALGHLSGHMPLVTMVYAEPLSYSSDAPTPSYVQTCLTTGMQATAAGLANGVMTYELPKDDPAFLSAETYGFGGPFPAGDLNGDGQVTLADYSVILNHWLQTVYPYTNGDLNADGVVNLTDYTLFRSDYIKFNGGSGGDLLLNLMGDYNADGTVDARDYVLWRSNVGRAVPACTSGDANCNGFVESAEYGPFRENFGRTNPGGSVLPSAQLLSAVPEPAIIMLFGIAAVMALPNRWRKLAARHSA